MGYGGFGHLPLPGAGAGGGFGHYNATNNNGGNYGPGGSGWGGPGNGYPNHRGGLPSLVPAPLQGAGAGGASEAQSAAAALAQRRRKAREAERVAAGDRDSEAGGMARDAEGGMPRSGSEWNHQDWPGLPQIGRGGAALQAPQLGQGGGGAAAYRPSPLGMMPSSSSQLQTVDRQQQLGGGGYFPGVGAGGLTRPPRFGSLDDEEIR